MPEEPGAVPCVRRKQCKSSWYFQFYLRDVAYGWKPTHLASQGFAGGNSRTCCRYWDFLILAFVIYNAVSVPHEAAFAYTKSLVQSRMEDIIDVLFALDVIYTFRTAYLDPQGEMVRDGGKIVSNYLGSWFPIDILASLPLEYIVLVFGLSGGTNLTYFAFLKVQLPYE